MLSLDAKELGYSALIQVVKAKTGEGFVPNTAASVNKVPCMRAHTAQLRRTFCAGAGEDNGIDHSKNGLRFLWVIIFSRSHDLHPHPELLTALCAQARHSQPPVGSKVLREMHKKYNDTEY